MRTIQKERITHYDVYVAFDGTEFVIKEECEKYENSAIGALLNQLQECTIKKDFDFELDECDNSYRTIVPNNEKDIITLNHIWFMYGGKAKEEPKFNIDDIGTVILMGVRSDGCDNYADWIWFYKLNDLVSDVTNKTFEVTKVEHTILAA